MAEGFPSEALRGQGGSARGYSLKARLSVGRALKADLDLGLPQSLTAAHPRSLKAAPPTAVVAPQLCGAAIH